MLGKLYRKLFPKRDKDVDGAIKKLNKALRPDKDLELVFEEVNQYEIKGHTYKLGDKVIGRSNECDPLLIGTITELWNNDGNWVGCIPQIKDDNGDVFGAMGIIKPYTEELIKTLEPMRPLEQWNYLLDEKSKKIHSYTEEEMDKKEKQYKILKKRLNSYEK